MPTNNTGRKMRELAARFPGQLGHLIGAEPGAWRAPFLPYALDNGAFGAHKRGAMFDEGRWLALLAKASACTRPPAWALIPDQVGNAAGTFRLWDTWSPRIRREFPFPLAFAVQDGMTAADVPADADVVFIGGQDTRWKRRNIPHFGARFDRVHVGRINGERWLWLSAESGAESCDGTGWFMGDASQYAGLERYLADRAAGTRRRAHGPLFV